jgi:predicted ATPase
MIHRRLITLYARRGEREAAMRQFEACVRALERELGVDPLPETRAAFEAAQRGEPDGQPDTVEALPRPRWHTLPSLDLPLIGREEESRRLAAVLERANSGGVVFISGEPGIGKSRLMQAAASAQEATILLGECRQATQSLPFQPLVEALRLALPWPGFGAGVQPVWLAETAQLLPELREHSRDLPRVSGAGEDQARLFEALIQVFLGLAAQQPLLLCLDDLHWADETTLNWLRVLAPRLSGSGFRLLATYRSAEPDQLLPLQRALRRLGALVDVRLDPLSEEAVDTIVSRMSTGHAPPNLSDRIYRLTGGNTFFVLEIVRDLSEQDLLENPPQTLPVPPSVLETVQQRVGRLTPLARQLLDAAAVLETNLTAGVIQSTTGRSDMEVGDGLDELVQRQLLLPQENRFRFQHDLVRTAVNQQLTPWRRRLLNRRAGEALEAEFKHDLDSAAAQVAHHFDNAGEIFSAVRNYERAAAFARRVYANHEALQYYERAIELLLNETTSEHHQSLIRLYEGLGQVARRQAAYDRAEEAYRSMLSVAEELGDQEASAQALLRLGQVQDSRLHYAASLESAFKAKEIAAMVGSETIYGHALYAQAWALFRLNQLDEALPIAQEALAYSMEARDHELMAFSQNTLGAIYKYQGHYQQSDEHQQQALELFQEIGDTRRVAGMLNNLGETARLRGDYDKALDYYRQAVKIAGRIGERDWLVEFLYNLGLVQIELEQYGEAKQSLSEAVETAQIAELEEKATEISRLLDRLQPEM